MKFLIRIIIPAVLLILALLFLLFHFYKNETIMSYSHNNRNNIDIRTGAHIQTMDIQNNLKKIVHRLSRDIGSRGYLQLDALRKTSDYIVSELKQYGYTVSLHPYTFQGNTYSNLSVEIRGEKSPEKILIIGAHYDTVTGTPGADDNASGIAGLLELARILYNRSFDKTVRFVAFTLEEPPLFRSKSMGSYVYARSLNRKGEDIEGMICLEMIGYFTDKPESQFFPLPFFKWFYPEKGNFITLVSNMQSKGFLTKIKRAFKKGTSLPVESISTVSIIPGIDFSDHRSFWKFGYNALMVTDTAFFRNPNYHGKGDTAETLDYERMAEVVLGLKSAIEERAGISGIKNQ
ncbi:M28 family peptidase [bacterium]|nr:MAG: M28 family peptidase [bacterium]